MYQYENLKLKEDLNTRGESSTRRLLLPKIGKNMILWRKIVIFHTKYPKNVRAFLRSTQDGLWCLTPLSTIYRSVLLVEKTGVFGENH
jgi:hypothetical protein